MLCPYGNINFHSRVQELKCKNQLLLNSFTSEIRTAKIYNVQAWLLHIFVKKSAFPHQRHIIPKKTPMRDWVKTEYIVVKLTQIFTSFLFYTLWMTSSANFHRILIYKQNKIMQPLRKSSDNFFGSSLSLFSSLSVEGLVFSMLWHFQFDAITILCPH